LKILVSPKEEKRWTKGGGGQKRKTVHQNGTREKPVRRGGVEVMFVRVDVAVSLGNSRGNNVKKLQEKETSKKKNEGGQKGKTKKEEKESKGKKDATTNFLTRVAGSQNWSEQKGGRKRSGKNQVL